MRDCKQTNRKVGEEWYTCARCGFPYPRSKMIIHNGLQVCTVNCFDHPGYQATKKDYPGGYEKSPEALPSITEDL